MRFPDNSIMNYAPHHFVFLTTVLIVGCTPEYGSLESPEEAIEATKKHLTTEVNLGNRDVEDYKFDAELHKSWTIPSNHCEDLQGYTEEEWKECNPPMYSVTVTYKNTPENLWDHHSWYDDEESIEGCFSAFFVLFKSDNGEFVDIDEFVVLNEQGETKCN